MSNQDNYQVESENINEKAYREVGSNKLKKFNKNYEKFYEYEASSNRSYFSTSGETFSRIMIITSLFILCISMLVVGGMTGESITETIPWSPILNPLGPTIFKFFALLLTTIFIIICLFFLIGILLVKTLRSLLLISYIYTFLGSGFIIFVWSFVLLSVLKNLHSNSYNIVGLYLISISFLLMLIGSINLNISTKRIIRNIEMTISDFIKTRNKIG